MTSCVDVATVTEQLCYIHCNFCNIVLAVSVPCSSLFGIVTVRCGNCTNLWSVNMAAAFQLSWQDAQAQNYNYNAQNYRIESGSSSRCNKKIATRDPTTDHVTEERGVNRPPEKRQRVSSEYSQLVSSQYDPFIKGGIRSMRANNPDISHREAFSTTAKNWPRFSDIYFELMLVIKNQAN